MTYEEWAVTRTSRGVTINPQMAFQAGVASQAERIAELENTVNHLILESTGWMNAASFHRQKADQLRELLELDAKAAEIAEQVTFDAGAASRDAEVAELVAALERLARLGNGDQYGNSDGNRIAQAALAKVRKP